MRMAAQPLRDEDRPIQRIAGGRLLLVLEEVLVDLLEDECLLGDDAAVVLDHEAGELGSVDEDEAGVDPVGVVVGLGAEA
jgi:hypothetical protein